MEVTVMEKTKKVLVTISQEQEQKILDKYGVHDESKKIKTFWLRVFITNAIIDRLSALGRYEAELYRQELERTKTTRGVSTKMHTLLKKRRTS